MLKKKSYLIILKNIIEYVKKKKIRYKIRC